MIKIEETNVIGWEAAIRGMRNPMNSWDKSDSEVIQEWPEDQKVLKIGPNDLSLMIKLYNAGTDHRKFMRMITVYVDITAPLYWWKEFDTYKVGTVANSCSTMHKIHAKEFTLKDFSTERLYTPMAEAAFDGIIDALNNARENFLECTISKYATSVECAEAKKHYWDEMIQLLPSSYNQRRTVMLNYEVLANIYKSRKNHKLDEWHTFCDWIESLPYFKAICLGGDKNE